jgi:uncharacterized protein YuzE
MTTASMFMPRATYLGHIDVLYVQVRDADIARTRNLGHWRNLDLDAEGNVVAVEFIDTKHEGVDLTDSDAVLTTRWTRRHDGSVKWRKGPN